MMICKKPFRVGVLEYGCGQCLPCRIDRRRLWSCRLMLEAREHKSALFVTLTYRNECLPMGGTLVPKHMQDFLKRLRFFVSPMRIRFYGVGEYGERRGRPHYHLALFGADTDTIVKGVEKAWTFGEAATRSSLSRKIDIHVIEWDLAWYLVGYICKRMTKFDSYKDKHPEFARMSLRPGIGAVAIADIAESLNSKAGAQFVAENLDVPGVVVISGKKLPLGRYLMRKLRDELGYVTERRVVPDDEKGFKVVEFNRLNGNLVRKAKDLMLELMEDGGRVKREGRRQQSVWNAEARWRLTHSKREM